MANWNNPTLTSTYTNFVTEVKDRDVEAAVWFEGMTPTNLPTNAKRLNTSTGRFEKWNGTAWVDAVATFTFPALSVAGATTLAGALTLSAGTANGVAYLNGSKVLTTGAALTFNGTNFGIGTASPATKLHISGVDDSIRISSSNYYGSLQFYSTVSGTDTLTGGLLQYAGVGLIMDAGVAQGLIFRTNNGSERMCVTSAGRLGIATTAPAQLFHVAEVPAGSGIRVSGPSSDNAWAGGIEFYSNNATTVTSSILASSGGLLFTYGGSERMLLDASGNFGLGAVPSAYGDTPKLLIYGGATATSPTIEVSQNGVGVAYHWQMRNGNGIVGWMGSDNASFVFGTGTSTERVRIDSSGNLISNSSVTGHWQIPNGTTAQRPTGAAGQIRFNTSLSRYEGHNGTAWSSIGGGATGGGSDDVFYENGQTVTTNYTITTNKNAMSAGPVTIASGITVTIPSGSTWAVV